MKVAHIVRRFSRAEWGGTETVVAALAREQRARGHDPRVFCTDALQDGAAGGADAARVARFGYFYPYWPLSKAARRALDKKGGNPFAFGLFRAVAAWRPDVIHVHAGGRLAACAVRLGERLGAPTAISLHGGAAVVPQEELEQMLRPLRRTLPYGGVLDRILGLRFDPLARASAVLALSRAEVARLKARYPKQRIEHFPNGIDLGGQAGPEGPERREGRASFARLLCVSRIDYQKNQLALLDLLAAEPACTLTLVGPVTADWYAAKIRARAKALGLEGRVTLVPGLPPDSPRLAEAYAAADVFVLPSLHEPFGIVALEAMRAGLPLLAANVGGLPDFVKDGENGLLFDPSRPETLVAAYRRLTPACAARLAANGRATAAAYAWPALAERLTALYRDLVGGARR